LDWGKGWIAADRVVLLQSALKDSHSIMLHGHITVSLTTLTRKDLLTFWEDGELASGLVSIWQHTIRTCKQASIL
jgi:hypothetical protein